MPGGSWAAAATQVPCPATTSTTASKTASGAHSGQVPDLGAPSTAGGGEGDMGAEGPQGGGAAVGEQETAGETTEKPAGAGAESAGEAAQQWVLLEVSDHTAYGRVKLCRTMVMDHFVASYLVALDNVTEQLSLISGALDMADVAEGKAGEMVGLQ